MVSQDDGELKMGNYSATGQTQTSWDRLNRTFGIKDAYMRDGLQPIPPSGRVNSSRLGCFWYGRAIEDSVHNTIIRLIRNPNNSKINWVFDSNIIRTPATDRFWDQLFEDKTRVFLPDPVYEELSNWIGCKVDSPDFVLKKMVFESFQNQNSFKRLSSDGFGVDVIRGMQYYVNLLAKRKRLDELVSAATGIENHGKVASYIEKEFGKRAKILSSESRHENRRRNLFNDEAIIWYSIVLALVSRMETAIVTFDRGMFEQFWKSTWMLDTHYRAMLFASAYARDSFQFKFCGVEENPSNNLFVGRFRKYEKPSSELLELLPRFFAPITISCFLFNSSKMLEEQCSFTMDSNMIDVVKVKGRTGGRSTEELEARNCHIWLGPGMEEFGDYVAIGKDVTSPVYHSEMGKLCDISLLDMHLILNVCEGGVRYRPTNIWVPEGVLVDSI